MNVSVCLSLLATILTATSLRAQTTGVSGDAPPAASQNTAPAAQEKKHAKHVYTDEDFAGPPSEDLPPGAIGANNMAAYYLPKDPMTAKQLADLQQFANSQAAHNRVQSIEAVAKLYLRDDDVPFRGRDDWNRRASDAWTEIVKAISDFAQKLLLVRADVSPMLAQKELSPQDVAHLHEQRMKLIAEWEPALKAVNHFIVLQSEVKDKAAEWKKYNAK